MDPAQALQDADDAWRVEEDSAKARKLIQELTTKFPNSIEADKARQLLREINMFEGPASDVSQSHEETTAASSVTITDIDISFWNMVGLLVKLSFAVIPAALIIAVIWFGLGILFSGFFPALTR